MANEPKGIRHAVTNITIMLEKGNRIIKPFEGITTGKETLMDVISSIVQHLEPNWISFNFTTITNGQIRNTNRVRQ